MLLSYLKDSKLGFLINLNYFLKISPNATRNFRLTKNSTILPSFFVAMFRCQPFETHTFAYFAVFGEKPEKSARCSFISAWTNEFFDWFFYYQTLDNLLTGKKTVEKYFQEIKKGNWCQQIKGKNKKRFQKRKGKKKFTFDKKKKNIF